MHYALFIFDDPLVVERMSEAESARIGTESLALTARLVEAGSFRAGGSLGPVTTATTIRIRGGKRLLTDGPFADTPEHLTGYYLVEAKNLDEALGIAGCVPQARFGAVEVRPVRRVAR